MHVFTSQVKHIFGIETSETFSGALKLVYVSSFVLVLEIKLGSV